MSFPLAPDVSMEAPSPAADVEDDEDEGDEEEDMETPVSELDRVAAYLSEAHRVLEENRKESVPEATRSEIARAYAALFDLITDSHWSDQRVSGASGDTLYDHMERRFDPTPPATEVDASTVRYGSSAPGSPPPSSREPSVNPYTGMTDDEMAEGLAVARAAMEPLAGATTRGTGLSPASGPNPLLLSLRSVQLLQRR